MRSTFYQKLGVQQKYYDEFLQCIKLRKKLSSPSNKIDYSLLFSHILSEYPQLFYVRQDLKTRYSLFGTEIVPQYIYSIVEEREISLKLEKVTTHLLANLINEHQSEYDKVRIIHDYLKNSVQYDTKASKDCCLEDRSISESHTIVGALINHKSVCEGFAKALKFLCNKIGIICWVIFGSANSSIESGPHAWNLVRINGYYHHVDVTWDNQYSTNAEIPNYGYLNLSDEEISRDHTWDRKNYPACLESPYNYFRVNNALIDSKKQLEKFLVDNLQSEEEVIMFKVVRGSQLEEEILGYIKDVIWNAVSRCKYVKVDSFRINQIPEQRTFLVRPQYNFK